MTRTMGWLIGVPVAAVAMVFVTAAGAQEPRTGEQIMNGSCQGCHDTSVIQTAAKSEEEWNATIDRMITLGAVVVEAERPALVEYLVRFHGPMPDGPGKQIVLNTCTICHDLTRIKRARHSPEEWEDTLVAMLNEGAPLSDADFPIVHQYLSKNFGY